MVLAMFQQSKVLARRLRTAIHGVYYYIPGLHRPTTPLLILGHMRCGSTLLAHLLNSHAEIVGYGETCRPYARLRDLWWLRAHVFVRQPTLRIRARYVTDKLVEDKSVLNPCLLSDPSIRIIFLAREPEGSLSSLRRFIPDWSEAAIVNHYTTRHGLLNVYARFMNDPKRAFFLTHHQLLHHSEAVLDGLTAFLGLDIPLAERYETTALTGHNGDRSDKIWAGRIVRDYVPSEYPVTAAAIEYGRTAHRRAIAFLTEHAQHIEAPFEANGENSLRTRKGIG